MHWLMLTFFFWVKVRTCGRAMGMTIGAMLEEIQTLYQQHKQSCFLYLSSEVIKVDSFFQRVN
jgi:transportin-3